jgi:hypothetical protein
MRHYPALTGFALVTATLLWAAQRAQADVVRVHFGPADSSGQATFKMAADGAQAEWQPWRGSSRRQPYTGNLRPTHMVTFRHAYTGQNVHVPLALPEGTPRIEHVRNRVVFNYGSYTVEVQFFSDGSLDAIYNSGLFGGL